LLVADNKTIVPRARGATGNAVKSNAWDENEVLLEGEELITWCSIRSLWASEASGPGGDAACARAGVEIGTAHRGAVVRQDRIEAPTTWLASVNAGYPGEYSDRGAAMARVQAEVERLMEVPLHDGNSIGRGRDEQTPP
jgi:hypothetical protein